jgi:DNA-binding response OmpR family regulator
MEMTDTTFYKRLKELKVCIVENDELLRDSMVLFFRTKGCRVQAFGSAEEASPVLESRPPDIVICDHGLPGMDGLKFLSRFGAEHPDTVKILISAHPSARLAEEGRRAGIDEVLLKPFSIEEIERTLSRRFQSRSDGGEPPGGSGEVPKEELA